MQMSPAIALRTAAFDIQNGKIQPFLMSSKFCVHINRQAFSHSTFIFLMSQNPVCDVCFRLYFVWLKSTYQKQTREQFLSSSQSAFFNQTNRCHLQNCMLTTIPPNYHFCCNWRKVTSFWWHLLLPVMTSRNFLVMMCRIDLERLCKHGGDISFRFCFSYPKTV